MEDFEDFINIHLNSKLFFSKQFIKQDYNICYSDLIDDFYYNFAYLKNNNIDFNNTFKTIKDELLKLNRQSVLYITSNLLDSRLEKYLIEKKYELLYTDSWLILEDINKFSSFKSPLGFTTCRLDKAMADTFAKTVMLGFSGENPDDPYDNLSDGYEKSIAKSVLESNDDYKIIHYVGQKDGNIISTASAVCKNNSANLYNITTNKKYQNLGVCRQMMSDIIYDLKNNGINRLCVQTEKDFYPEQIYQKFGFKEAFLGFAYKMEE